MTFRVQTDTLRTEGNRLVTLSGDTSPAISYVEDHLVLSRGDAGMFQLIVGAVDGVRGQISDMLRNMERVLDSSGVELRQVAHMYDSTDHEEAARYDASLAPVSSHPTRPGAN